MNTMSQLKTTSEYIKERSHSNAYANKETNPATMIRTQSTQSTVKNKQNEPLELTSWGLTTRTMIALTLQHTAT